MIAPVLGPGWASAKINLALHIVGQRDGGYHLIESLVVFTRFGDRVTVGGAEADEFHVTGPYAPTTPLDEGNLVLRARNALRGAFSAGGSTYDVRSPLSGSLREPPLPLKGARTGAGLAARPLPHEVGERCPAQRDGEGVANLSRVSPPPAAKRFVSISLEKNLPVASGIGGGSSDAAATLKGLARLWGVEDEVLLTKLGLSLGADVPMCLSPYPALVSGIGETVKRLSSFPPLFIVLVNPGVEVSTPAVFSRLKAKANPPLKPPVPSDREALYAWLGETRNDLQAPALELAPVIGEALAALRATPARFVRMSGSGATCFGLFDRRQDAEAAAAEIRRARAEWFVIATATFAA